MRSCLCARSTLEVFINDIVGLSLGKKAHRTALINRTPSQRPTLQKRAIHGYQRSYTTQAVQETAANLESIVETGNNIPSHTSLHKDKHTSVASSRSVVKDSERQDARLARKNRRIANGLFRAASKVQAGISKWKTHSNETEGKSTSKRSSPRRARSRALTQKGSPRNSPLSTKSTPAEEENVEDVVVRNILSNALEPKVRLSKRSRDSSTDEKDEQETTPPTPVTQTPDTEETEQYERPYWQIQKAALKEKFGDEGWKPRKRLSPDSLNGIRALHQSAPDIYTTPVLSQHFKITPEAIRRILKSKWMPREDEIEDRRKRWERRGVLHRADIRASSQRSKNARELKAIFNPVIDPETLELKPLEKTKRTG